MKANAHNIANNVSSTDSLRNWPINCFFTEPNTFRIPTSLALLKARAVERLVKFTQASNKIKIANAEKIYTYWMSPPGSSSYFVCEYKWMRVSGCNENTNVFTDFCASARLRSEDELFDAAYEIQEFHVVSLQRRMSRPNYQPSVSAVDEGVARERHHAIN